MTKPTEAHNKPVRILQITDTHLYAEPDGKLLGLNTLHCLEQVIAASLPQQTDIVVVSGDLTHDSSAEAYRHLRNCFSRIQAPVFCLPGNHDEATALPQHVNQGQFHSVHSTRLAGWQLLFLDSTVPGSEGGHLADQELLALENSLARQPEAPTLVWLHHQPVEIGSAWLDTMAVDNPEPFFEILQRHNQVRAVIWGHIHQAFDRIQNGVRLLATPSTCIQFLPGSADFALETIPPGYRWIELYPDGSLKTGIERLASIPGEIDLSARGY